MNLKIKFPRVKIVNTAKDHLQFHIQRIKYDQIQK